MTWLGGTSGKVCVAREWPSMTLQRPLVWHGYGTACEVMASRPEAKPQPTSLLVEGSGGSPREPGVRFWRTPYSLRRSSRGTRLATSCYGHRYRPEDTDDEKNLSLIPGDDATRARRDHRGWHTGDKDADRNTGVSSVRRLFDCAGCTGCSRDTGPRPCVDHAR